MDFVYKGSDYNCLKSLSKQGLVQRDVQVRGKHGTYVRKQWVSAGVEQQSVTQISKEEHPSKSSKTLYFPVSSSGSSSTKAYTYSDIMTYYSKNKSKINKPIQKFIKENYFISDGKTQTQDFYKSSKGYSKERQKLHKSIIKSIVDSANSPKKGEKPIAILMGGGTASGKGTLRSTMVVPRMKSAGINVGISDCDDIKEQLPEYKHFQEQDVKSAAYRVHQESMDIAMEAFDELVKNNKNLLFDGTMKSPDKYSKMIDKLHKAGYYVQIIGADVPVDIAVERSSSRAKKTGRTVPHSIIMGSHGGFASTYPELLDKVDGYSLYDNSGKTPVLIHDEHNVYNKELYQRFQDKGTAYKTNKKIGEISRRYNVSSREIQSIYAHGATLDEIEEYYSLGLNLE